MFRLYLVIFGLISLLESSQCIVDDHHMAIPFELKGHAILFNVKINDSPKTYKFAFDTGGITTINPRLFEELNVIPAKSQSFFVVNLAKHYYQIDSLQIGPVKKVKIDMLSLQSGNRDLYDGLDGFIGLEYFEDYTLTLDYKNRHLLLSDNKKPMKANNKSILLDYRDEGKPTAIRIELKLDNDLRIKALLDTGCPVGLILPVSYLDSIGDLLGQSLIESNGVIIDPIFAESGKSYMGRIPMLQIDGIEFRNMPAYFFGFKAFIGEDFLQAFKLTIDQRRNEILLERHDDGALEHNILSFGLNLTEEDSNRFFVKGVWENSSADEKGISLGDEILEVNGKKVSEYENYELHKLFTSRQIVEIELKIKREKEEKLISLKKKPLLPEIQVHPAD